jgi:hypothetical protein
MRETIVGLGCRFAREDDAIAQGRGEFGASAGMPPLTHENAMMEWGQETCAKYGQPSNPMCAMAVATITGYCESRKQMR